MTAEHWLKTLSRYGVEVRDEAQIASFLQTWLYFGLLHEVTGKLIYAAAFKAPGRTDRANVRLGLNTVGK